MFPLLLSVLSLLACDNSGPDFIINNDTEEQQDTDCPVIVHEPIETTQRYGEPVPLLVTVTDEESGVFLVKVFYRQETSDQWVASGLTAGEENTYVGEIPGVDVRTGGMYYYLYAVDTRENDCYQPESGENDAWHFRISSD